jgi:adenine-specific DNA-methyltransferase
LDENILANTKWATFENKSVADLFAGTGVVSYHFRNYKCKVSTNDAELYSFIIAKAMTCSVFTDTCKSVLENIQAQLNAGEHSHTVGFITKNYSPYEESERMFFTTDNAQRIDFVRNRIEEFRTDVTEEEYAFILASLLLSADAVSNVPAVYGCYLKNFKSKAQKHLVLCPIHINKDLPVSGSTAFHSDVLFEEFLSTIRADMVYLDPPYNNRQYSKNYFPLNMIALTPEQQVVELPLKGKTGIPESCFLSNFCRKGSVVEEAFNTLFKTIPSEWIFLSYSSDGIVSKDKMVELMEQYGRVSVCQREYKKFKSFEYNTDTPVQEFLFCLHKSVYSSNTSK